jgi:hypothetical protein
MLERRLKDLHELCFEFNHVFHDIAEESIQNLEASVNFSFFAR